MKFARGDEVVWLHDGQEITAVVLDCGTTHEGVEFYHIEVDGQKRHVTVSDLLAKKKPGFEIRDLAFIVRKTGEALEGEIVAIGNGPKDRKFYQLKFEFSERSVCSWFNEDQVFIMSGPSDDSEVGVMFA